MTRRAGDHEHAIITYPEEDGAPLGETEVHVDAILHLFAVLKLHLRDRSDVYVGADLLLYYEEGDPRKRVAPDVFVAIGAEKQVLRTYKLWEQGVPPTVVIEITSKSSEDEDRGRKRELYARLGVSEYYLFDPLDEYLLPRLQGLALRQGGYEEAAAHEDGSYLSPALGLALEAHGPLLRLRDPETGRLLPTLEEEARDKETAERRAEEQTRRAEEQARRAEEQARGRQEAEAEVARLRAELDRLRHK